MNETRNKRPIQFSIFGVARWLPVIGRTVGWYDVRHVWAPANKEIENRRRLSVGFDWKIPFCWAAGSLDEFVRAFQVDSHADDNAPAGCYYIKLVSVSACQNRQMSVTGGCRRELPRSPLTCSPPLLITSPMNKSTKLKTRPVSAAHCSFTCKKVAKCEKMRESRGFSWSTCHFRPMVGHFGVRPGQGKGAEWSNGHWRRLSLTALVTWAAPLSFLLSDAARPKLSLLGAAPPPPHSANWLTFKLPASQFSNGAKENVFEFL